MPDHAEQYSKYANKGLGHLLELKLPGSPASIGKTRIWLVLSSVKGSGDSNGSRVPLHPMRNRSFTEGLVPSTGEHPVWAVKRSLAWSDTD